MDLVNHDRRLRGEPRFPWRAVSIVMAVWALCVAGLAMFNLIVH